MREDMLFWGLGDRQALIGLEIGALDNPLIRREDGRVIYVDFTDTATLKAKYADFPDHDASKIVDVDAIWGDKTLAEAVGDVKVDYIVASHVIEHVPDLITWLGELNDVLVPHGTVRLAIPDRRYSFDIRREESKLSEVLYANVVRARKPLPHQVLDFSLNFFAVDCQAAWAGQITLPDPAADSEQLAHGVAMARHVLNTDEYLDVHCWVFTPISFARLMQQLCLSGHVKFRCLHWWDTHPNQLEFVIVLQNSDDREANVASWAAVVKELQGTQAPAAAV